MIRKYFDSLHEKQCFLTPDDRYGMFLDISEEDAKEI